MTGGEEEQVHREKTALQAQHAEALRLCGLCLDDLKKVEGDRPVMVTVRLAYDLSVLKQHLCDLHAELEDMDVSSCPHDLQALKEDGRFCSDCGKRLGPGIGPVVVTPPHPQPGEPGSWNDHQPPNRECMACGLIQPATNTVCPDCGQTRDLVRKPEAITEDTEPRAEQAGYALEQQEDY